MKSKRSLLGVSVTALFVLALAGCGGSDGTSSAVSDGGPVENPSGQPPGQSPGAGSDSFIDRIRALIADTSETAEPIEIESITVTAPENTEPVPLS